MANTTSARSWWWREFEPIVRLLSATIIVGAASGAVIGGLGGRLAMGPACHERPITPNVRAHVDRLPGLCALRRVDD